METISQLLTNFHDGVHMFRHFYEITSNDVHTYKALLTDFLVYYHQTPDSKSFFKACALSYEAAQFMRFLLALTKKKYWHKSFIRHLMAEEGLNLDEALEFLVEAHQTKKHILFASEIVSALLNEQLKDTNIVVSLTEKPKNANKNKRKKPDDTD